MYTPQILVVDDNAPATESLCRYLARFGLEAFGVAGADAMRDQLQRRSIDLVVLSLTLPGFDGLDAARMLRRASNIPLIMLTARGDAADRIIGLETGADDCLARPFEPRELVARIQNVLRRAARSAGSPSANVFDTVTRFDGWQLDRGDRRLTSPAGMAIPLSNAEYQLLTTFLTQPRRVLSRDQLAVQAQGRPTGSVARSIDLLVSRLRQKLSDACGAVGEGEDGLIKTVRGDGYMLNARSVRGGVNG